MTQLINNLLQHQVTRLRSDLNHLPQQIWGWFHALITGVNKIKSVQNNIKTLSKNNQQYANALLELFKTNGIDRIKKTEWGRKIDDVLFTTKNEFFQYGCDYVSQFPEKVINSNIVKYTRFSYLFLQFVFILRSIESMIFMPAIENKKILSASSIYFIQKYNNNPIILDKKIWFDFCFNVDKTHLKHINKKDFFEKSPLELFLQAYFNYLKENDLLKQEKEEPQKKSLIEQESEKTVTKKFRGKNNSTGKMGRPREVTLNGLLYFADLLQKKRDGKIEMSANAISEKVGEKFDLGERAYIKFIRDHIKYTDKSDVYDLTKEDMDKMWNARNSTK